MPPGHYLHDGRQPRQLDRQPRPQPGVGYVPYENFVGRAEIIFFSIDEGAAAWQFWSGLDRALEPHVQLDRTEPGDDGPTRADVAALEAPHRPRVRATATCSSEALTHSSAAAAGKPRPDRTAISVWSFSATACSASSSPTCCSARFPRPRRASCRAAWPIWCARRPAPRSRCAWDLGPHLRLGAGEAQSGGRARTDDPRRRLRGADRRGLSRRRLPGGAGADRARSGASGMRSAAPAAARRQDGAAGMGAGAGTADAGLSTMSSAAGPITRRAFRVAVRCRRRSTAAEGQGRSKRAAEQAAAASLSGREGVLDGHARMTRPRPGR